MKATAKVIEVEAAKQTRELVADVECMEKCPNCDRGHCVRGQGHPGDHTCNECRQPF